MNECKHCLREHSVDSVSFVHSVSTLRVNIGVIFLRVADMVRWFDLQHLRYIQSIVWR